MSKNVKKGTQPQKEQKKKEKEPTENNEEEEEEEENEEHEESEQQEVKKEPEKTPKGKKSGGADKKSKKSSEARSEENENAGQTISARAYLEENVSKFVQEGMLELVKQEPKLYGVDALKFLGDYLLDIVKKEKAK